MKAQWVLLCEQVERSASGTNLIRLFERIVVTQSFPIQLKQAHLVTQLRGVPGERAALTVEVRGGGQVRHLDFSQPANVTLDDKGLAFASIEIRNPRFFAPGLHEVALFADGAELGHWVLSVEERKH